MRHTRPAATPPEVLALLAILGFAAGLVLPGVQRLRAADAKAKCSDNLRRIGTAAAAFSDANAGRLPHNTKSPDASWNTQLLPHLGADALARRYAPGEDWTAAPNRAVVATPVPGFVCPTGPRPDRLVLTQPGDPKADPFRAAATDYVGSAGVYYESNDQKNLYPGAMHTRTVTRRLRLADVEDGGANTLLIVEMADKPNRWQAGKLAEDRRDKPQMPALNGQWAAPNWNHLRSYSVDGTTQFGPCAVNCSNGASVYGFHPAGANALFVDGSVRLLKAGLSQELLVALVTIAGGELLAPDDYAGPEAP